MATLESSTATCDGIYPSVEVRDDPKSFAGDFSVADTVPNPGTIYAKSEHAKTEPAPRSLRSQFDKYSHSMYHQNNLDQVVFIENFFSFRISVTRKTERVAKSKLSHQQLMMAVFLMEAYQMLQATCDESIRRCPRVFY